MLLIVLRQIRHTLQKGVLHNCIFAKPCVCIIVSLIVYSLNIPPHITILFFQIRTFPLFPRQANAPRLLTFWNNCIELFCSCSVLFATTITGVTLRSKNKIANTINQLRHALVCSCRQPLREDSCKWSPRNGIVLLEKTDCLRTERQVVFVF